MGNNQGAKLHNFKYVTYISALLYRVRLLLPDFYDMRSIQGFTGDKDVSTTMTHTFVANKGGHSAKSYCSARDRFRHLYKPRRKKGLLLFNVMTEND